MKLLGKLLDGQTRCEHYHSPLDVIALRFACCDTYYPCYECHLELADHKPQRWPRSRFDEPAVLCGVCRDELTATAYFESGYRCPSCATAFNPGCGRHAHLYFEMD